MAYSWLSGPTQKSSFSEIFNVCIFDKSHIVLPDGYALGPKCKHWNTLRNHPQKSDGNSVIGHFLSIVKPFNEQFSECALYLFYKGRL